MYNVCVVVLIAGIAATAATSFCVLPAGGSSATATVVPLVKAINKGYALKKNRIIA